MDFGNWILPSALITFIILFIIFIFVVINKVSNIKQFIENNEIKKKSEEEKEEGKLKAGIKEDLFNFKESLKDGFNKDIMALTKEVGGTMLSNVEKSQLTASNNIKDISDMITKSLRINNESLDGNFKLLENQVSERLNKITEKVEDKLSGGFDKSNDIYIKILTKIELIEEAQNKIEDLSKNVVDLQSVLTDKQSRGAWGEVQLEQIIGNSFPRSNYEKQYKLSNDCKVDFLLRIPDPSFDICVDSKFPFENYKKMVSETIKEIKIKHTKQFKIDVKKHIDDIAKKYIIIGETADYALMFLPAEAVFSEIHSYHYDLVEYAQKQKVLLVSPTTMTAILTTAYSAIKDDSMKRQLTKIKSTLGALYEDFDRLDNRMNQLKSNVMKVNDDIEKIDISSRKIGKKFKKIQSLEFEDKKEKIDLIDVEEKLELLESKKIKK